MRPGCPEPPGRSWPRLHSRGAEAGAGRLSLGCPTQPTRGGQAASRPFVHPSHGVGQRAPGSCGKREQKVQKQLRGCVTPAVRCAWPLPPPPCPPPATPAITQAVAPQIGHEIGTLRGDLKLEIWARVCKMFKRQKQHKASILIIALLISRVGFFLP